MGSSRSDDRRFAVFAVAMLGGLGLFAWFMNNEREMVADAEYRACVAEAELDADYDAELEVMLRNCHERRQLN